MAAQAAGGSANPLGNSAKLTEIGGVNSENLVGFAQV